MLKSTNATNKSTMDQLLMMFVILVNGGLSLSEEQIASITQILMTALIPQGALLPMAAPGPATTPGNTVRGMQELAQFLGVSVPTACKLSQSGKFDEARLNFGTKKFVWDRAKLIELARMGDGTAGGAKK